MSIAEATLAAAHRRNHDHPGPAAYCRPHVIEVVYLGPEAAAVCHDCRQDSTFLPYREAERIADQHRRQTRTDNVALPTGPAAPPAHPECLPLTVPAARPAGR
jgi:hypothetical protein